MNDLLVVGGFERRDDLKRNPHRFFGRHGAFLDPVCQGRAIHELHHDDHLIVSLLESVDRRNVRVIHRGEKLSLAFEASQPIGIVDESLWEHFDRDIPAKLSIRCAPDFAHAARADLLDDFIRPEACTLVYCHSFWSPPRRH